MEWKVFEKLLIRYLGLDLDFRCSFSDKKGEVQMKHSVLGRTIASAPIL